MPKLSAENDRFYFILKRIFPGLHNGSGGFSYEAIKIVFDEYGLTGGKRQVLFDRTVVAVTAIQDHRQEKNEKAEAERANRRNRGNI